MSTSELATSYAALILADDGVEITADKLQSIITAAKVPDVEPIWCTLFAKALEGKDVKELLLNVGSGGGAAAAPAAGGAGAAAGGAAADEAPKEEAKEEEKEESDEDMGFGLFD
ncbi:60s acidic ribosomal protein-domain-containing protein [Neohortaea acidophila]|uniref:Large ribosomal subunit protein P1 n=1 Tax=Neohortaea acidophila TaxID=245834 RepID=A0A6A6PJW3_9PEZI|nr:60s acidic ribosomal protein-domain-containing protein [Neohortaea acidophila]KAF2480086.1 60s acidic ribosomal protein-domain-containing protein [Neohortaea acidophila]